MIISIINTTQLRRHEVQNTLRAVNRQLQEDFRRYWHTDAELRLEGWTGEPLDPDRPFGMRGDAIIYLLDGDTNNNALGYHAVNHAGVPYGFVFTALSARLGEPWSVTLSHEALELALDPEVNRLVQGPHPNPGEAGRTVYHWYELCDAVQGDTYQIDGVRVSNFLLPLYFTDHEEHVNHNDFLGTGVRSFGVRSGGYVGFFDPDVGRDVTYHQPDDLDAVNRLQIKSKFANANRRNRRSGDYDYLDDPRFVSCDAISFELRGNARADLPREAERIVAECMGHRWRVRPCPGDPLEYDALPAAGIALVSFAEAWEAARRIEGCSAVTYAEPSFTFPVPGEFDRDIDTSRRASSAGDTHIPETERHQWALEQCNVPAAWKLFATADPGGDVLIGHPDSGFLEHPELDLSRVRLDLDRDFLDDDQETRTRKTKHGSHGLATASVIISGKESHDDVVVGPAPHAHLLPLRVTKPGLLPSPVLFSGGMRRLRDAVYYAVAQRCEVISISLGGFRFRGLHKALIKAHEAGVIVCAAAGNEVGFVVSPASYPETIAVAGSNIARHPWIGSCRGDAVDITAPAESVWRAHITRDGQLTAQRGNGTSFAAALLAGIAALWLSYKRNQLAAYEHDKARIPEIFRQLLRASAARNHKLPKHGFGAGIVDAHALLTTDLPPHPGTGPSAAAGAQRPRMPPAQPDPTPSSRENEHACAEALTTMVKESGIGMPTSFGAHAHTKAIEDQGINT